MIIIKGKIVVVSGPSGVGKGTICKKIMDLINAKFSVSTTTRSPREGEIEGKDYFFVTKEEFKEKIEHGEFLEYNIYNDNYYGTSKNEIFNMINKGINALLEIDVNGAYNIKKKFPEALLIYIAPPSMEVLKQRLIDRGTEELEVIENRLKIAEDELKRVDFYDYVIINDDLDTAVNEVKECILKKI